MNEIKIYKDGDSWCALLGENLQEGFAGFGDSPIEALINFRKISPEGMSSPELQEFFDWSIEDTSDGYHTFKELYEHRCFLYLAFLFWHSKKNGGWRSRKHHDGSAWEGWFLVGTKIRDEQISYHLPIELWDFCDFLMPYDEAPEPFDGHTPSDVIDRLKSLLIGADRQ